jgi:hypothetical protein
VRENACSGAEALLYGTRMPETKLKTNTMASPMKAVAWSLFMNAPSMRRIPVAAIYCHQ